MSRAVCRCPLDGPEHNKAAVDRLEEVKEEGETYAEKPHALLAQEEGSRLLKVLGFLKGQIGGKPDKTTDMWLFESYTKRSTNHCDHYFETQNCQGGPLRLASQGLSLRPGMVDFFLEICAERFAAETSACAFWNDLPAQEIAMCHEQQRSRSPRPP